MKPKEATLIERIRLHLSCYWREGDPGPQLTTVELELLAEAADALAADLIYTTALRTKLAAAIAERDKVAVADDAAKVLMDCKGYDLFPDGTMRPAHGEGEWVKAEDYDKLHAAAASAQAEIAMLAEAALKKKNS